jgi:hypothetical protein
MPQEKSQSEAAVVVATGLAMGESPRWHDGRLAMNFVACVYEHGGGSHLSGLRVGAARILRMVWCVL